VRNRSWGGSIGSSLRLGIASALAVCLLAGGAMAQGLIPADFFNTPIDPAAPTAVEADALTFDATTNTITAAGDVVVGKGGYTATGQNLVFNRQTNDVHFVGAVVLRDPSGNLIETEDLKLTEDMKKAFIDALTINTYDGARITADSADYDEALQTLLTNARYAPCGDCIDAKGRRIGWSVNATKVTYNAVDGSLAMEQPTLSLLGIPVAWLPYLWLPNLSDSVLADAPTPVFDYSDDIGLMVAVPIKAYSSRYTDIILTPTLLTRQGFLLGAEWVQRFDQGSFRIKASGLQQMDPGAFAGTVGDREWRGAIQSAGQFRPVADWTVGWSYTAFSDAGYFEQYRISTAESSVNEVYATNLTSDTYIDLRLQRFNQLGEEVTEAAQDQQAAAVPNARFDHVTRLGPGLGQIEVSGRLLGVKRELDHRAIPNGVPYTLGYGGDKTHAMFQAGWQTQWIGGGGFVATPYLGGRADVAYYDGTSPLPAAPGETTLWSATPIAAMDVRFPMAASDGSTVHLVEPIAQLVYRGASEISPGITNDDAMSFVFDDTNLFSYNRFSGADRQETGLRANIGGRYQANFDDGGYVEVIAGQSFQLAGTNAFAEANPSLTGLGSGMDESVSYAVLGAYASFTEGLKFGGKLQVDTDEMAVSRGGFDARYGYGGYSAGLEYQFIAANEALGVLEDQQEIGASLGVPIDDYWRATGGVYWDLTASQWLQASAGLAYDDGYLQFGATAIRTGPTHTTPDDTRFIATFAIKAPAGFNVGYSGLVGSGF
jgi:LPS-assembly protein